MISETNPFQRVCSPQKLPAVSAQHNYWHKYPPSFRPSLGSLEKWGSCHHSHFYLHLYLGWQGYVAISFLPNMAGVTQPIQGLHSHVISC